MENDSVIIGDPTGAVSSVTVSPQTGSAVYGGAVDSVAYTVAAIRGSNGQINGTYTFSGLPAGVTGNLSTTTFTVSGSNAPPTSQLTLQVASTVPAGSYPFTVSCVLDGATVSSTGILLVSRAPLTITGNVGDGPDGGLASNYNVKLIPGELAVVLRFYVLGVDANSSAAPYVQVINSATGTRVSKFLAYESTFTGGVRVVRADLTGDGVEEIITAPRRGRAPDVRVFSLQGAPLTAYNTLAYATSMINGIQIAAGDVNGDGRVDLVTVPSRGSAEVRVFLNQTGSNTDPMANAAWRTFLAFPSTFIGGAVLALADMGRTIGSSFVATPDGKPEILVGSGAGMRATVRVFDAVPATPFLAKTMLFFASTLQGGIASLAVGRVNGNDNIPDVIAGAANGGNAMVEVRDGQTAELLSQFSAYNDFSRQAPVRLTTRDTNGDGVIDEIWTAQGTDGKTRQIKRFRVNGAALDSILENDVNFQGEYFLA